jgi:hypothetical protein
MTVRAVLELPPPPWLLLLLLTEAAQLDRDVAASAAPAEAARKRRRPREGEAGADTIVSLSFVLGSRRGTVCGQQRPTGHSACRARSLDAFSGADVFAGG